VVDVLCEHASIQQLSNCSRIGVERSRILAVITELYVGTGSTRTSHTYGKVDASGRQYCLGICVIVLFYSGVVLLFFIFKVRAMVRVRVS